MTKSGDKMNPMGADFLSFLFAWVWRWSWIPVCTSLGSGLHF